MREVNVNEQFQQLELCSEEVVSSASGGPFSGLRL